MDKVKQQLALVKQHSFWVMCAGILIVCLVSWYLATAKINQERASQLTAIQNVFKSLDGIRSGNAKHPNEITAKGMDALNLDYSREVMKSWQLQYDRQASVLVWPASFTRDAEFMEQVDKLRPIEIVPPPPTPIAQDIPVAARLLYRNYIEQDLPTLAETIGTDWRAKSTAMGAGSEGYGGSGSEGYGGSGLGASAMMSMPGASGYGGTAPGSEYGQGGLQVVDNSIVVWATQNQQEILNTHFGFVGRETAPSTVEVLYAQEDLWVLQNIMDLIKAANDNATARHEAAIKEISFIRLGRSARGMAGTIMGGAPAAGMGGSGMGMGAESMMSMGSAGSSGGTSAAGSSAPASAEGSADASSSTAMMQGMMGGGTGVATDPAAARYVDEKYQPLDPKRLRDALTSKNKDDALLAVAKRMPIRLRFKVDQRKMNKVLAECGNARLPIEVRQVRINRPPAPVGGDGGGGYGGGYGGESGGGMMMSGSSSDSYGSGYGGSSEEGYGGSGGSGYGAGGLGAMGSGSMGYGAGGMPGIVGGAGTARAVGGANSTAAIDYNLIEVELFGIVYIYNPVNKSQLGLDPAAGTAAAPAPEATTPTTPTTPASSPSPPATTTTSAPPAAVLPGIGN